MLSSDIYKYIHDILVQIPSLHWLVGGVLALAVTLFLLIVKKRSVYGSILLGITVFVGLLLLETAVVLRYCGIVHHQTGYFNKLDLGRFHDSIARKEVISNITVFVPFGFFLSEYLAAVKRRGVWRRLFCSALVAFLLSLLIEFLQIFLHVGFFDVTDLVMNTVGGVIGACLALLLRFAFNGNRQKHT